MGHDADARRAVLATGINVAYVVIGESAAPPVLFVHAWGETRRSFDQLISLLPASICAIAFDQRGHGDSDKPEDGDYSLEGFARDIDAFLDAIGVSSAVLVGSSSGGYVAQQVAIRAPRRVAGLVLLGSPRSLRGRPPFADEIDQLTDPISPEWVRESLTWFPRFHSVPTWYIDDRVEDGVAISALVWRSTFYGLLEAQPPTDAGTITAPTLIVWGERDQLLTREDQEALAAAIPNARLVIYEETGHLLLWEQPDRLAADLIAFVDDLSR